MQRLRELGWIEGGTVAIEWRWAEGRSERFAEIAAELAQVDDPAADVVYAKAEDWRKRRDHFDGIGEAIRREMVALARRRAIWA